MCDVKPIIMLPMKTVTSVLKVSQYIITNIRACPNAEILVILSVSTFITVHILYLCYGFYFQTGQMYPPNVLLDFYPLAAYCNHVLTAFNDLRLCAPVSMACEVSRTLETSLQEVNRIILAFHRYIIEIIFLSSELFLYMTCCVSE